MKYKPEDYIDRGIYSDDEDVTGKTEKVVKCRKPHKCVACGKEIQRGEHALCEKGFMDGKPVSSYTCLPCVEEWLEESGQVEIEESGEVRNED